MSGHRVATDTARARRLLTAACDRGSAEGCGALGSLYAAGLGVPRDLPRGMKLYGGAC